MDEFDLRIFERTSDYSELRFNARGTDRVFTRGLDQKAIGDLVAAVGEAYGESSLAQRLFTSAQLRQLGEKLYTFLDGDDRWLTQSLTEPQGAVLRIDADQKLRHLPWELIARDGSYLTVSDTRPLLPVRTESTGAKGTTLPGTANRPLRVLFMATSPEGIEPVLNYEFEEAGILRATAETSTELVVEESGTLEGLRFTAEAYGSGYFDVLHISGHATVRKGEPMFFFENELGATALVTATKIARSMAGQWPRVVFVSGCLTGNALGEGVIPSMSESLVRAGAPCVLGWALPVGDVSASVFAADLYRALAAGHRLDQSIVTARQKTYATRSPSWHLLRVYADASPLTAMVTPLHTPGRERLIVRHAADEQEFLDPQTRTSRVASRMEFVGRRRVIQRCLRTLKAPLGRQGSVQALVLQGMGGLGKSTLASRLLERMPTHQRVVWYGNVDLVRFRELVDKIRFPSLDRQAEASAILASEKASLETRVRYLLDGPLATTPCLFVFDDFEQKNIEERPDGTHVLSGDMAQILPALLKAIDQTNSASRVIITSRYQFPTPAGATIHIESLETFTPVEQAKKIASLPHLAPESRTPDAIKDRAIEAAAGNPRLLDWLDKIITDDDLDVDNLIRAIENETDRFRKENIFAEKLLASQPSELQKMLAKVNVVELPVPAETVFAMHDHPDASRHIDRAVQLGLLEAGTDPETGETRYFVSNVLRPLIRPRITDDEYTAACAAAARSLHTLWLTTGSSGTTNAS